MPNPHQPAIDLLMDVAQNLKVSDPVAAKMLVPVVFSLFSGRDGGSGIDWPDEVVDKVALMLYNMHDLGVQTDKTQRCREQARHILDSIVLGPARKNDGS